MQAEKALIVKTEFPTLESIALRTVARNYHLYPELQGIPERTKEKVSPQTLRSFKNP